MMDIEHSEQSRSSPLASPSMNTPGRRKLALFDENDAADISNGSAEKKTTSRASGGGLRQFSVMVSQKLEAKKITTYKEVADEIIAELAATQSNAAGASDEFNEKNIRRRVYDALNVFMALDIIARDKKEIRWKGLPITCTEELEAAKKQCVSLRKSIEKKAAYLKELEEQVVCLESLISRNRQIVKKSKCPTEGFALPFILVKTSPHATVEVEISEDMQLVHFDFNSTPFSLHDDAFILRLMHCHKLQQSGLQSQHSSAHSSSSSCIASGITKPFSWNSVTRTSR